MPSNDNKKKGILTAFLFGLAISICVIMHTSLLTFGGVQKLIIARFAPIILCFNTSFFMEISIYFYTKLNKKVSWFWVGLG